MAVSRKMGINDEYHHNTQFCKNDKIIAPRQGRRTVTHSDKNESSVSDLQTKSSETHALLTSRICVIIELSSCRTKWTGIPMPA